jgi:hypothetical protein
VESFYDGVATRGRCALTVNKLLFVGHRTYQLEGGCQTLEEIERAVESFKRQALPQIEHSLLEEARERFVERGKKARPPAP